MQSIANNKHKNGTRTSEDHNIPNQKEVIVF
jgi:hypothetical protein